MKKTIFEVLYFFREKKFYFLEAHRLLEVDFQQLRIENQQYLERINQKNQDLIHAKLKAGKIHVSDFMSHNKWRH